VDNGRAWSSHSPSSTDVSATSRSDG